jgi:two-component system, cell cycle sensor histidine kinase and response regulator CckA
MTTMKKKSPEKISLKVLYLEDSPRDVEIIYELLKEAGYDLSMDCTAKKKEFTSFLRNHTYDIILSDFSLPGFNAFGALQLAIDICPETPFICVSGSIGEETAIELIRKGAVDYILKDRIIRLPIAIKHALEEAKEKKLLQLVEEELYETKQRFQILAENSPVGIFQTDAKGSTTYVNPRWCQISGISKEEALGIGWVNAVHNDDKGKLIKGWKKATQMLDSSQAEYRFVRKDGTIAWVIGHAIPERDHKNKIVGYVGTITDITERRRVEETLRENEEIFKQFMDHSPIHVFFKDEDIRAIRLSKNYETLLGKSMKELLGKNMEDIFPSEFAKSMVEDDLRTLKEGKEISIEEELNGRYYSTIKFPIHIEGKPRYLAGYTIDITERKKAEEALRESERRLSETQKMAQLGHWIWDVKTGDVVWSEEVFKTFQLNPKEFTPHIDSILELSPWPEDHERDKELIRKAMASHEKGSYEQRFLRPDKSIGYYFSTFQGKYDSAGNLVSIVGTVQDITDRKRAEEALRESEKRFSAIFSASPIGISITNVIDGKIIDANPAVTTILGYSRDEIIGRTTSELQMWVDPEVREIMINALRGGGSEHYFETKCRRKSGEIGSLLVSIEKIELSQKEYILSMFLDITERKQAEAAVEEQSAYFRQLFESSPVATMMLDTRFIITDVNQSFIDTFQYTKQELMGEDSQKFIVPLSRMEELHEMIRQIGENGSIEMFESLRKRKDGESINVLVSGHSIIVRGLTVGYYIMYVDITDERRLRDQLMHSQKMESLGTLAGGIAHDFNNILAIILGHSGFILRHRNDDEKFDKSIEAITKSTYRGISLVKQLLTFARKSEAHLESVQVNDLILEVTKLLGETFPKIISVTSSLQKGLPALVADATQIHQVILNLCVNARDAMPRGGTLSITTTVIEGTSLMEKYAQSTAAQYVQIDVHDTGIGMDQATMQKIFEPFYTTKGIGKGTGLGLALVYGVIGNHNGIIDVESTLNEGTVFHIYLPIPERISEKKTEAALSIEDIPGGSETVLLIEDEELLRDLVQTTLTSKGYTVITADEGAQGFEKFLASQTEIAIVITDLGLPVMGGEEVLTRILQIKPEAKIVLASGFIDPETKLRLIEGGAKHFIQKPYSPEEVLQKIRKLLDEK